MSGKVLYLMLLVRERLWQQIVFFIFDLDPFATIEPNIGIVQVPDERLYAIANLVKPEKITPTTIKFVGSLFKSNLKISQD